MSNEEARIQIGHRLRLAREHAGLTQSHVAKELGLHRPAVSEIEAGRRRLSADELAVLCDLYDVSSTWVLENRSEAPDAAVELAARKLAKLKPEDLDAVLSLLRTLRPRGVDDG